MGNSTSRLLTASPPRPPPPRTPAQPSTAPGSTGPKDIPDSPSPSDMEELLRWARAVLEQGRLLNVNLEQMPPIEQQRIVRERKYVSMPELALWIPPVLRRDFYNRPVYDKFLSTFKSFDQIATWACIVAGDSGIGKSTFALRLICQLAAEGQKVLFKCKETRHEQQTQIYADFSDPENIKVDRTTSNHARFERYLQDETAWLLLDGLVPEGQFEGSNRTVVFSSSSGNRWKEFKKSDFRGRTAKESVMVQEAWMPWWGEDELMEASRLKGIVVSEDDAQALRARILQYGGIARHVLGMNPPTLDELSQTLPTQEALNVLRSLTEGTLFTLRHEHLHAVVNEDTLKWVRWEMVSDDYASLVQRKADGAAAAAAATSAAAGAAATPGAASAAAGSLTRASGKRKEGGGSQPPAKRQESGGSGSAAKRKGGAGSQPPRQR